MNRIESLLRHKIGLDVASVGASAIERAIRLRLKSLGFKEVAAYLAHVEATPSEWEELLEAIVVTETWFFRDASPFHAFVQLAQQELAGRPLPPSPPSPGLSGAAGEKGLGGVGHSLPPPRTSPLRVLSVPCSTGEEPFSLVMALHDAGIARNRFSIEGVDISARALERARRGVYGRNSFRGRALGFRDRHFTNIEGGFLLNQAVRDDVRFARGNLLEETFLTDCAPYDFVFCRNLLIYFDRATQRLALQCLRRLLTPSGVLFVGAAELPLVLENGFTPLSLPMAFGCRKSDASIDLVDGRTVAGSAGGLKPALPATASLSTDHPAGMGSASDRVPRKPLTNLDEARGLADAGRLGEAAVLCEAHVKALGPSAEAYYLLGLVCDATGDAAAMDYYRKALYLEPNHYETLLQLALLLERNGDRALAQTFKRRAERLQQKG